MRLVLHFQPTTFPTLDFIFALNFLSFTGSANFQSLICCFTALLYGMTKRGSCKRDFASSIGI